MNFSEALKKLGLTLPEAPPRGGLYSPYRKEGSVLYISGCGPSLGGETVQGKLGKDFTLEQGQEYTRACLLNALAIAKVAVGEMERLESPLRLTVFVAGTDEFYQQPAVADGGCQLLSDLFGPEKLPIRSAVGVNALAGNIPVEVEISFLLKEGVKE